MTNRRENGGTASARKESAQSYWRGAQPMPGSVDDPFGAANKHATDAAHSTNAASASASASASAPTSGPYSSARRENSSQFYGSQQQSYTQGQQQSQSYQQPYVAQPYVETKDHVAAGLLAIFLGAFGIHKFYLGYNTAGFVMLAVTILGSLLSFGMAGAVMTVIAIIEGIIYLSKSQTEFDREYVYNTQEWF